jgi:hypothetical protein
MKRLIPLLIVAIMLAIVSTVIVTDEGNARDKAKGSQYSGSVTYALLPDTTAAYNQDTSTTKFRFDEVVNYSSLYGYMVVEYTAIDTGDAAADIVDTTKDTVIVIAKTYGQTGTPSKEVWRDTLAAFHVTASVVNTDYVHFVLSDSALYDYLAFDFIWIVADSDNSVARAGAAAHYKATTRMYAK